MLWEEESVVLLEIKSVSLVEAWKGVGNELFIPNEKI